MATAEARSTSFDPSALARLLDGRYADGRDQIREVFQRPEFAPPVAISTADYRQNVFDWARTLAEEGRPPRGFPREFGGTGDPGANVAAFETLAYGDLSLLVKFGVQFGLGEARFSSWAPA
jgi:acyl-CoA oxidase